MSGKLSVVALPLGNLGDVSARAGSTLESADVVYAEDTRSFRKLCQLLDLNVPPSNVQSLDLHHEARKATEVVGHLDAGRHVALVSEAGTPGINDPGARVVAAALAAGHPVVSVPGPSILSAALSISGYEGPVAYLGFAPKTEKEWAATLDEAPPPYALFFLESPKRLRKSLGHLHTLCPDVDAVLFHELTKVHEGVLTGPPGALLSQVDADPKGEWAMLILPRPADEDARMAQAQAWLAALSDHLPHATAVKVVAKQLGVPRNRLYGK